jgi:putative peptidoglycan lipid II flippase
MAVATVSLTELAYAFQPGRAQQPHARALLADCLEMGFLLLIPFAALMLVWANPLLHVLFMRGSYDAVSLERTAVCLRWYALALLPGFAAAILFRALPALGRPWSLLSVAALWTASTFLVTDASIDVLGAAAVPAGFLAGQVVAVAASWYLLRADVGALVLARVGRYLSEKLAIATFASAIGIGAQSFAIRELPSFSPGPSRLAGPALGALSMFGTYLAVSALLRDRHLRQFLSEAVRATGLRRPGGLRGERRDDAD